MLILLSALLCIIFVFYIIEIHPYLLNKLRRNFYMLQGSVSLPKYQEKVLSAAVKLSKNETPKMSLADNTFFPIVLVRLIYLKLRKNNRLKNSFPRAFLLNGIFDYAKNNNRQDLIEHIHKTLYPFVKEINNGKTKINYIDQVSMGMVFMKMYETTNKVEYKEACDTILDYILNSIDQKHNLILYRKGEKFHYVDVIGMVCPFLLFYAKKFNQKDLILLVNHQVKFYMQYGVGKTKLPFHGIELENFMPIGSSNWGRGLGWYLLGLSAIISYTSDNDNPEYLFFKQEMDSLFNTLEKCQNNHYWGQFLGIAKKWDVDTSVSCMLIYSLNLSGYPMDKTEFYKFIKPLTSKNGLVDFTSGDTEDINLYSRESGFSEFTQGLLLSIFSLPNNKKQ